MDKQEPENFTEFCRLCLTPPTPDQKLDLSTIYDETEGLSYSECFRICTGINLCNVDGNIPCNLCKECGLELQMAYDFYKKVEESKKLLQLFTGQNQENHTESKKPKDESDSPKEAQKLNKLQELKQCLDTSNVESASAEEHNDLDSFVNLEECAFVQEEEDELAQVDENETTDHMPNVTILTTSSESAEELDNQTADELTNELVDEVEYETIEELEDDEEVTVVPTRMKEINGTMENRNNDEFMSFSVVAVSKKKPKKKRSSPTGSGKHPRGQYHCYYCDKMFKLYSRMKTHERIHEADRPKYMCNICNRIYASKQALSVHDRTVHTKTTAEECHICGKRFAIAKLLEVHMRYHTGDFPFQCDLCEKKFAQRSHLKTHQRVHHNQARFLCGYANCGKFFTSCHSLRSHEYTHSGMPFECAYCKRGFPGKAKLKVHIRTKHEEELTLDQLEEMRKFFVSRSKPHLVQILEIGEEE